jgi:hypothetical protein
MKEKILLSDTRMYGKEKKTRTCEQRIGPRDHNIGNNMR